jgi:hypothetical protein
VTQWEITRTYGDYHNIRSLVSPKDHYIALAPVNSMYADIVGSNAANWWGIVQQSDQASNVYQ